MNFLDSKSVLFCIVPQLSLWIWSFIFFSFRFAPHIRGCCETANGTRAHWRKVDDCETELKLGELPRMVIRKWFFSHALLPLFDLIPLAHRF